MTPFELVFFARNAVRDELPEISTIEDFDIAVTIGLHQARGQPITAKVLSQLQVCRSATLFRRLSRLKGAGIVIEKVPPGDARLKLLLLSASTLKVFNRLTPRAPTSN